MKRTGLVTATLVLAASVATAAESIPTKVVHEALPEVKQTITKLYVTAAEAYDAWKENENIKILDVRTVAEYVFVGHPAMASNVPLLFASRKWDGEEGKYAMPANEKFMEQVAEVVKADDVILIICRSGHRSAKAANMLTEAGYKHVYSIVDGFEGEKVKDPDSKLNGKREKNGWRNVGLPWTCSLNPELIYQGD